VNAEPINPGIIYWFGKSVAIKVFERKSSREKQMEDPVLDSEVMLKVAKTRMPFGKYKGRLLLDLPEPYVVWFSQKGFPEGELGRMLSIVYEVKLNGLEYLFKPLK
jgi:hypothetical protein